MLVYALSMDGVVSAAENDGKCCWPKHTHMHKQVTLPDLLVHFVSVFGQAAAADMDWLS